jgi:hypothetical protein
MKPSSVFRFTTGRAQLWHPWPAQVGDFNADDVVRCLDCDRDRLAAGGRAAVPDAVGEKLVHQQGSHVPARVPGAEYPVHERTGDPRPLRPPAPQESWSPGPPQSSAQPPFPARTDPGGVRGAGRAHTGCTLDSVARVKPGHAASAARPWRSVDRRRCAPTVVTVRTDRRNCARRLS